MTTPMVDMTEAEVRDITDRIRAGLNDLADHAIMSVPIEYLEAKDDFWVAQWVKAPRP